MVESDAAPKDPLRDAQEISLWDREPDLIGWEIATWEHAVSEPGSNGIASRVADTKRILPRDFTEPIYVLLARAEAILTRRTEPIPPFRERLARDFNERNLSAQGNDIVPATPGNFTLDWELQELLQRDLSDVVPNWDTGLSAALGTRAGEIARNIQNFAPKGLPTGQCSLRYGYRINLRRIPGRLLGSFYATHGALLMGCRVPDRQPGPYREVIDCFKL
jgi:hypothetical protein